MRRTVVIARCGCGYCTVRLVLSGVHERVLVHCHSQLPGPAEKAFPGYVVSCVFQTEVALSGYCEVRIGQVREFGTGNVGQVAHAVENLACSLSGCATVGWVAIARSCNGSDSDARHWIVSQIAVLVVDQVAVSIPSRILSAESVQDASTMLVVRAQVE